MEKQYKPSINQESKNYKKNFFDGIPLILYLTCQFWAHPIQQQ